MSTRTNKFNFSVILSFHIRVFTLRKGCQLHDTFNSTTLHRCTFNYGIVETAFRCNRSSQVSLLVLLLNVQRSQCFQLIAAPPLDQSERALATATAGCISSLQYNLPK